MRPNELPQSQPDRDERTSIPLDPEAALRALLKVDPDSEPVAPSPVEVFERALQDAEAAFGRDPSDRNAQAVTRARQQLQSAREFAAKNPGWNQPASR